jgi:hypothetical protein
VKLTGNLDKFSPFIYRNPPLKPFYSPFGCDKTLVFESRFESGNLELAVKVSDSEYNLVLQHDTNTAGNTQWFFFRVSNTVKDLKVRFNIVNLGKGDSLFNYGMRVMVFSEAEERINEKGWHRGGENILYHKNSMLKPGSGKSFYSVTFSYLFHHSKDTVYFAYSIPYTYSDLMKYLLSLENNQKVNSLFSRRLLCTSIGGNRCDYLTITSSAIPEYTKHRKGVVISSRVHPGESVGSWMMHGAIEFLLSDSAEASLIRDNYVVKVIPMLNPDGVINGNYRCNLAGADLNRKWKSPSKLLQPTIYHSKRLIKSFSKERKLGLICDLHGHSRRMNVFMYGCNFQEDPQKTREFPFVLSKISSFFDFRSCSFHMQRNKESTLRISMFKEVEIPNVFTLEASFCGGNGFHYSVNDLKNMGADLCKALLITADIKQPVFFPIKLEDIQAELRENKELLVDCPDTSGSESEPSEDNLDEEVLLALLPKPPKKIKKKRKTRNDQKSNSVIKSKRDSLPARTERFMKSVDREKGKKNDLKNCPDCGEVEVTGHICVKRSSFKNYSPSPTLYKKKDRSLPTSMSSLSTYVNVKGKKVRDQATQTMYVKKKPLEGRQPQSVSLMNMGERSLSPGKMILEKFIDTKRLKDLLGAKPGHYQM